MPSRPQKICSHPGCAVLVQSGRCASHRTLREDTRGTAASRGYDRRWRKLRRWYIARHPMCQQCDADGISSWAEDVDHIVPFDGKSDPKRLDAGNLQALCRSCHNRKTHGAEGRGGSDLRGWEAVDRRGDLAHPMSHRAGDVHATEGGR